MKPEQAAAGKIDWPWIVKHPLEVVLCGLLVAIVAVTFVQVLFRYVFHLSLAWSEESARFLLLWLGSLASAYAFKTKSHIALTFLVNRFQGRARRLVNFLVVSVCAIFFLIFIWKASEYVLAMSKQVAPATGVPMAVPYSSAVVGGLLMLYYVLRNWWMDLRESSQQSEISEREKKWD